MMKARFVSSIVFAIATLVCSGQTTALAEPCAGDKTASRETVSDQPQVSSEKNSFGHKALKVQIKINAPPGLVWDAIRENRAADPDVQYSKFTRISDTQRMVEQKYTSIPIFGATTCVLQVNEDVNKRIDYNLVKSDRLSEFEGSWILTYNESEHCTILALSNHLKLNLPLPQRLIDAFAAPKMKARVQWVKTLAENKNRMQIASNQ